MEYFENLVRLSEIETANPSFLSDEAKALKFSYIAENASSTPSVNIILETFNAYQYRIIVGS